MLVLILFASLGSLKASPVPATSSISSPNADDIWTRDIAERNGDNVRTTYGIIWSCVVTVFACVWSSAHPNIPGPRDAGWTRLKRRAVTMLYALIAPEMVAMWAIRQHIATNQIVMDYNEKVVKASPPRQSLWEGVKEWFTELPETEAQRSNGQPWSKIHGFFVQMGGFMLVENGRATRVLSYDDLTKLISEDKIDPPIVTASEIKDRSKGDGISKGFVVLQTTWFVIQCITRLSANLALSELEVVTLGFALLNGIIYALWWNKPQGVGVAIFVPLKSVGTGSASEGVATRTIEGASGRLETDKTMRSNSLVKETPAHVKKGPLRRQLEEDWSSHHWLLFIGMVLKRVFGFFLSPVIKMMAHSSVIVGTLRVPMFYADVRGLDGPMPIFAPCAIGIAFGAVHLLGWSSDFPSRTELLLWRISTLFVIAEPTLVMMWGILTMKNHYRNRALGKTLHNIIGIPSTAIIPFYVVARFTLIVLAFLSLRVQPLSVFVAILWTSYIPHL